MFLVPSRQATCGSPINGGAHTQDARCARAVHSAPAPHTSTPHTGTQAPCRHLSVSPQDSSLVHPSPKYVAINYNVEFTY